MHKRLFILLSAIILQTLPTLRGIGGLAAYAQYDLEIDVTPPAEQLLPPDSLRKDPPRNDPARHWKYLASKRRLNLKDTTVYWPPFLRFCVGAYNWANRVFNSYDPRYVQKGWGGKVTLTADNWVDLYIFSAENAPKMRLNSRIHSDIGVKASYGVLSLGYSLDLSTLFSDEPANHKKLDLGFNCAMFMANFHYWNNKGPSFIRTYGSTPLNPRDLLNERFDGLNYSAVEANANYFFNNRNFCFSAGYGSGYRQLRSAGSAMLGFSYAYNNAKFNFEKLPPDLLHGSTFPYTRYVFKYHNFCISGGYSFNWVCNKHFLVNITVLPNAGICISNSSSTTGKRNLLALGVNARGSITYSHRRFFLSLMNSFTGNLFYTDPVKYSSGVENFQLSGGLRF